MKKFTRLNLHGVRHEDVRNEVIRFIEGLWGTGYRAEVITGHSPEMRELVEEVLDEYGIDYQIGGYVGVSKAYIAFNIP